jgi:hypothetical protein
LKLYSRRLKILERVKSRQFYARKPEAGSREEWKTGDIHDK